jgi:C4-type Zn-finger protein
MKEENHLKKGTLNCPVCKQKLDFEVWGKMRIITEDNGVYVYNAYCKTDNKHFTIKAPVN